MSVSPQAPQPRPAPGESWRMTVSRLSAAQKSGVGAPAYSRLINRPLGRMLAAAAYHLGLTPNGVTALSAVVTGSGIALIALVEPSWFVGFALCLLLVLGYALDAADGQLARLRGGGSPAGEWLDHVVDSAKLVSLHLAVTIAAARWGIGPAGPGIDPWLLIPLGFTVVAVVGFFAMLLNDFLAVAHGGTPASKRQGGGSPLVSLLKLPTDYGVLCLTFAVYGSGAVFGALYFGQAVATLAYLALALPVWFQRMNQLSRGGSPTPS